MRGGLQSFISPSYKRVYVFAQYISPVWTDITAWKAYKTRHGVNIPHVDAPYTKRLSFMHGTCACENLKELYSAFMMNGTLYVVGGKMECLGGSHL